MAGFMAGFGSAFSRSFEAGRERSAQKDQDMFRLRYQDLISQRDIKAKQKLEDSKNVNGAKQLASQYATPELWTEIYKMKQGGQDDAQIIDYLKTYEATITPTSGADSSGPADPRDDLAQQASGVVDSQMQASGMAPAAEGVGLFDGIKDRVNKNRQSRVDEQIGGATGMSSEEINSTINDGYESTALDGAPELSVQWKPKIDPKVELEKRKLELDQKRFGLEERKFQLEEKSFGQMSPAEKANYDLEVKKFSLEERGQVLEDQKMALEIEAMENPQMTPVQQAEYNIKLANLRLDTLKFEHEANKPIAAPEGTAIVTPQGKELYKNEKADDTDLFKPGNTTQAKANLTKMEQLGDPQKIELARKIYDDTVAEEEADAMRKATAEGNAFKPRLAHLTDGSGIARRGPNDTWVHTKTGQVVGKDDVYELTPEDNELLQTITKDSREIAKPYMEKVTNFTKSVREAKDMAMIIKENPDVMTWKGWAAKQADETVRNVQGLNNLFRVGDKNGIIPAGAISKVDAYEKDVQKRLQSWVGPEVQGNISKTALARSLIEIKAIKMAYAQAASVGQSGTGVAAKEFERFYASALNPNQQSWMLDMGDFVKNGYEGLKQEGLAMNQFDKNLELYKAQTGFDSPIMPAGNIDELIATDPGAKEGLDMFITNANSADPNMTNPNQMSNITAIPDDQKEATKIYNALRPGAEYRAPDGTLRRKEYK